MSRNFDDDLAPHIFENFNSRLNDEPDEDVTYDFKHIGISDDEVRIMIFDEKGLGKSMKNVLRMRLFKENKYDFENNIFSNNRTLKVFESYFTSR